MALDKIGCIYKKMKLYFKTIHLVLFILISKFLKSQTREQYQQDQLSSEQIDKLEKLFSIHIPDNAKIAFFNSLGGTVQRLSTDFFSTYVVDSIDNPLSIASNIYQFSEKEKSKHGYDFYIVYGSKNPKPKVNRKLIKLHKDQLKNNSFGVLQVRVINQKENSKVLIYRNTDFVKSIEIDEIDSTNEPSYIKVNLIEGIYDLYFQHENLTAVFYKNIQINKNKLTFIFINQKELTPNDHIPLLIKEYEDIVEIPF
jgi:hypothetical protein